MDITNNILRICEFSLVKMLMGTWRGYLSGLKNWFNESSQNKLEAQMGQLIYKFITRVLYDNLEEYIARKPIRILTVHETHQR